MKAETEEDVSTDDEHDSEMKEPSKPHAQNKAPVQENTTDIQPTKKRRYSKRKREAEESNRSVQKTARVECSVEGCKRKVLDSGKCWKHKGYNYCSQDGCTNRSQREGFVKVMGQ